VRHGARLAVDLDQGGGTPHLCQIRQNIGHPVCGDRVVWQPLGPGAGVVTALLPRSTTLARPNLYGQDKALAANLSQLVVVVAPLPEPVEYRPGGPDRPQQNGFAGAGRPGPVQAALCPL
jgi:ribosome biogenesis GTPase